MIKSISFRANTFVTSRRVDTSGVAQADTEATVAHDTFVPVDALVRRLVVDVTGLALAPEAAHGVHAGSVLTHT